MSSTWRERCRDAGGIPTVFPRSFGNKAGEPSCRFIRNPPPRPGVIAIALAPSIVYQDAGESFFERLGRRTGLARESVERGLGGLVEARDRALDVGISGIASKLLGIPKPILFIAVAGVALLLVRPLFMTLGQPRG